MCRYFQHSALQPSTTVWHLTSKSCDLPNCPLERLYSDQLKSIKLSLIQMANNKNSGLCSSLACHMSFMTKYINNKHQDPVRFILSPTTLCTVLHIYLSVSHHKTRLHLLTILLDLFRDSAVALTDNNTNKAQRSRNEQND
jgi:hypothetical protein